jgi:hypothetical protein
MYMTDINLEFRKITAKLGLCFDDYKIIGTKRASVIFPDFTNTPDGIIKKFELTPILRPGLSTKLAFDIDQKHRVIVYRLPHEVIN